MLYLRRMRLRSLLGALPDPGAHDCNLTRREGLPVKRHAVFRTPASFDELHNQTPFGIARHHIIANVPATHYGRVGTEVEAAIHHAACAMATHAIAAEDRGHVTAERREQQS
jgi:hypothetical protein